MNNFISLLENSDLETITTVVHDYFSGVDSYENKLKLSLATATIIDFAIKILSNIDRSEYISELKTRLDLLSEQVETSMIENNAHLELDRSIRNNLGETRNPAVISLDKEITVLLSKLDQTLKDIVIFRDSLPISSIVEKRTKDEIRRD